MGHTGGRNKPLTNLSFMDSSKLQGKDLNCELWMEPYSHQNKRRTVWVRGKQIWAIGNPLREKIYQKDFKSLAKRRVIIGR